MRAEILNLQRELHTTTLYVTHDQVEALTMGDRMAVMRKGVLQQSGPPQELYDRPANLFVATFIGSPAMNLVLGALERDDEGIAAVLGESRLRIPADVLRSRPGLAGYAGRDVGVGVRPEHLKDAAGRNGEGTRLQALVTLVESTGSERLVHLTLPGRPVLTDEVLEVAQDTDAAAVQALRQTAAESRVPMVARFDAASAIRVGATSALVVEPRHLHFFDLESGEAIR